MPSYEDPKQDADELGEVARSLAHTTRHIDRPADTYQMLGSLHYALTNVQQSLNQLASWHHQHRTNAATDDGNLGAGHEHAEKAGGWLQVAAASLDQVVDLVMRAQGENGRIAWQEPPIPRHQLGRPDGTRRGAPRPGGGARRGAAVHG